MFGTFSKHPTVANPSHESIASKEKSPRFGEVWAILISDSHADESSRVVECKVSFVSPQKEMANKMSSF